MSRRTRLLHWLSVFASGVSGLACSGLAPPLAEPDPQPAARLSPPAQTLLDGIARRADNQGQPFVVIDKRAARLWVFDGARRLLAQTPVLLGSAIGDHTVPGIGDHTVPGIGARPLSAIAPEERTTPAGRFALEPGLNAQGQDIFWIDYQSAVSLHRVREVQPGEQRLQRLASATPLDNRISYGCVNVPVGFYERHLRARFARGGLAYVLPELRSLQRTFPRLMPPRAAG